MDAKREQAMVGLFVLVAAGLLLATVFALSGTFGRSGTSYHTYFKFAGGLEPGAAVRYGGIKVGRVERVGVDPRDSTRIEIGFSVRPDTPIKTDSIAKITSLTALGDNYLEIGTGSASAPRAPAGSVLQSADYVSFADFTAKFYDLQPATQQLLENLNQRLTELQETIARVNDVLSPQNRANLSASLGNIRGMLEENRPRLSSTMGHVDTASAKLGPLLDDFKKTLARTDKAVADIDATIGENRQDLRQSIAELRDALATTKSLTSQLDQTLNVNAENIDELLDNLRHTAENLKSFTETIKARPSTLIRSSSPRERTPGGVTRP